MKTSSKSPLGEHKPTEGNDLICFLVHLTQLSESNTTEKELKDITKIVYNYILDSNNGFKLVLSVLQKNHMRGKIELEYDRQGYVFCVNDKWFYQVILLSSLVHPKKSFDSNNLADIQEIVQFIYDYTSITNAKSVFLLRTLENILNIYPFLITRDTLCFIENISISSIENFKFYCNKILKLIITHLSQDEVNKFLTIDVIPRQSIECKRCSIKIFSNHEIVCKILKLFENNIYNRDGGFLYQKVVEKYNFGEWKTYIWPTFLMDIGSMEMEGEKFQSYLKYWIPYNVTKYKLEFAEFICKENLHLDIMVMGHVLLETRKSGYYNRNVLDKYVQFLFTRNTNISFQILCTYNKKTFCPDATELDFIRNFIFAFCGEKLDNNELKSIKQFISQIFLVSHNILIKDYSRDLKEYIKFIWDLFNYCDFNLKAKSNKEFVAQIILIIVKIGSGNAKNLCLKYKLEPKDGYEEGENKFYLLLKSKNMWPLENERFLENIVNAFESDMEHSQYFTKLVTFDKMISQKIKITNSTKLRELVKCVRNSPSLQNIEKVKNYSKILYEIISVDEKNKFINETLEIVENQLDSSFEDLNNIFEDVLLLELMPEDLSCASQKLQLILQKSMVRIESILDKKESFDYGSNATTLKVLEAYINNVMIGFIKNKNMLKNVDKPKIFIQLCKIIRISNMKRPVTLSIEVLKYLGEIMEESEYDKNIKILFVAEILESILDASNKLNVKIRRSPESRLVLHAICVSEKNENKIILPWILNFLLDTISDENVKSVAISSSLHTLEILISDGNLYAKCLPYLPKIIKACLHTFKNSDWLVRNADLQLAKSIIERTHGVLMGRFNRPRDIFDLFQMCPSLELFFYDLFKNCFLKDNIAMALQFVLESQIKNDTSLIFLEVIDNIVQTYPNSYGRFAVMAYVALVKEKDIPNYFTKVKCKILSEELKGNVLWNYIKVLKELYQKYLKSYEYSLHRNSILALDDDFEKLVPFFQTKNPIFFSVACLNVFKEEEIMYILKTNVFRDFEKRIFEFNHVPYIFYTGNVEKIANYLKNIYYIGILNSTEIRILEILVDRYKNKEFLLSVLKEILTVLVDRIITIRERGMYLLSSYFEVVSLFFKVVGQNLHASYILHNVRSHYSNIVNNSNIYQIIIIILVLSNVEDKSGEDKTFIKFALSSFKKVNLDIEEMSECISFSLKYLYRCISCNKCKCDIFVLAFIVLMKHELYDFIDYLSNSRSISALDAFYKFVNGDLLIQHIPDKNMLLHLLRTFYAIYLNKFCCSLRGSQSFYVKNDNCFVSRNLIVKLLAISIKRISTYTESTTSTPI